MRVTSFILYNQLTRSLQDNMRRLFTYSERLSTGKKINKPSDDVSGMTRSMDYKSRISENDQYTRNIDDAYSYLEFADSIMANVSNSLTRARELAVEASTGTQSAQSRANIAEEVDKLRDEVFDLSNSQFRDRYIFSGYSTDTAAFDAGYNYQGNSGQINVMIDRNSTVSLNIPGDTAFTYGGVAFAQNIEDFRAALVANDETSIRSAIDDMENMLQQVANVRTDLGARLAYLDKQKINIEDRNYALNVFLSNTEDADLADSVSEMAKIEVTLESLRASGSNILSQSLLDFLR